MFCPCRTSTPGGSETPATRAMDCSHRNHQADVMAEPAPADCEISYFHRQSDCTELVPETAHSTPTSYVLHSISCTDGFWLTIILHPDIRFALIYIVLHCKVICVLWYCLCIVFISCSLYSIIITIFWPWTTKPVLSSTGKIVAIASNTLYGSKLSIFLLCQKSLGY